MRASTVKGQPPPDAPASAPVPLSPPGASDTAGVPFHAGRNTGFTVRGGERILLRGPPGSSGMAIEGNRRPCLA
jgi:hypothetical protein